MKIPITYAAVLFVNGTMDSFMNRSTSSSYSLSLLSKFLDFDCFARPFFPLDSASGHSRSPQESIVR